MKKSISKLLISALAVVTLSTFAVGCISKDSKTDSKQDALEVVKTSSNTHEISLEKGKWTDLNQEIFSAVLKKQNVSSDYVLIISEESKAAFTDDLKIKDYADLSVQVIKKSTENPSFSEFKDVQVNGKPAIQFEVSCIVQKIKIKYLITIIDDGKAFNKISLWTTEDKFDKARESFVNITNSFK